MSGADFIDARALGRHGWARTLGTVALTVAGVAVVLVPTRLLVLPWLQANGADMPEPLRSGLLALMAGLIFTGAMAGLFLGVRLLHGRSLRSLVTSAPRLRWGQTLLGFGLSGLLVGGLGWLLDPGAVKPLAEVDPRILGFSAMAMLVGFSIQAPAEEVVFRGYLLQVARRGFRSRAAAVVLSVALFTLAHLGYGLESALFSLTSAIGLTVCVLLLGGLEFAMGAHVANNLVVAFLFQDLSDANAPSAAGVDWTELAANIVVMGVLVATAAVLARRRVSP
jgi:hypothetical protein